MWGERVVVGTRRDVGFGRPGGVCVCGRWCEVKEICKCLRIRQGGWRRVGGYVGGGGGSHGDVGGGGGSHGGMGGELGRMEIWEEEAGRMGVWVGRWF
jgi:hypothetical protein